MACFFYLWHCHLLSPLYEHVPHTNISEWENNNVLSNVALFLWTEFVTLEYLRNWLVCAVIVYMQMVLSQGNSEITGSKH